MFRSYCLYLYGEPAVLRKQMALKLFDVELEKFRACFKVVAVQRRLRAFSVGWYVIQKWVKDILVRVNSLPTFLF